MKKTKKKLIGAIGLVIVAIMVVAASFVPSPNAEAAETDPATSSVTTTIQVIVHDKYPAAHITSPRDGSTVTEGMLPINVDYENIENLKFYLDYIDEFGDPIHVEVASFVPDLEDLDPVLHIASGNTTIGPIDLNMYNGYGDYTLTVEARGSAAYYEDIISFRYSTLSLTEVGKAENNDPIVNLEYNAEAYKTKIQVYDAAGNALFTEPIEYIADPEGEAGNKDFTLPFESYGAIKGNYTVVAISYDADDVENGMAILNISYAPVEPPYTPNTGILTGNLNISSEDYLITMLIVFACLVAGSIYFITRNKTIQKRSRRR